MKPTLWLRIASVLALINAAGHSIGLLAPPQEEEARAAIQAMQSHRFDAMGSMRTYWDFYCCFNWIITVMLLMVAALSWQLALMAKSDVARARPLIASLCLAYIAFAILSVIYLFAAPIVNITAVAVCLVVAWVGGGRRID